MTGDGSKKNRLHRLLGTAVSGYFRGFVRYRPALLLVPRFIFMNNWLIAFKSYDIVQALKARLFPALYLTYAEKFHYSSVCTTCD